MAEPNDPNKNDMAPPAQAPNMRMLVVLNHRRSMDGALKFLERRGYQLTVVNRISEAIRILPEIKPQSILLSWNLKNTDIKKTYKLLNERFHIVCVVFAEDNSTRTTASLMSSGIPHSLLAPVSGPSIHMRLEAIERNKRSAEAKATRRRKKQYEIVQDASKTTDLDEAPPELRWEKAPFDPKNDRLNPLWRAEHETISDEGEKKKTYYFRGPNPPKYDNAKKKWTFHTEDAKPGEEPVITQEAPPEAKLMEETQAHIELGEELQAEQEGIGKGPEYDTTQDGLGRGKEYSMTQEGLGKGKEYNMTEEAHEGKKHGIIIQKGAKAESLTAKLKRPAFAMQETEEEPGEEGTNDSAAAPEQAENAADDVNWDAVSKSLESEIAELESASPDNTGQNDEEPPEEEARSEHAAKALPTYEEGSPEEHPDGGSFTTGVKAAEAPHGPYSEEQGELKKKGYSFESVLYQALKAAVTKHILPEQASAKELAHTSRVTVIALSTERFKGYLVGTTATGEPHDELMRNVLETLQTELHARGEILESLPAWVALTTGEFPFMAWAEENAEFIVHSAHGEDSVAFAFLKLEKLPRLIEAEKEDVFGVELQKDILGNTELMFDLLIHLPKNKKFILYLGKGSNLSQSSLDKFIKFGVRTVYIRKVEKDLFLAYCAKNLITASVKLLKKAS